MRFNYEIIDQKFVYVDGMYFYNNDRLYAKYAAFNRPILIKIINENYLFDTQILDTVIVEYIESKNFMNSYKSYYLEFMMANYYYIFPIDIVKKT